MGGMFSPDCVSMFCNRFEHAYPLWRESMAPNGGAARIALIVVRLLGRGSGGLCRAGDFVDDIGQHEYFDAIIFVLP